MWRFAYYLLINCMGCLVTYAQVYKLHLFHKCICGFQMLITVKYTNVAAFIFKILGIYPWLYFCTRVAAFVLHNK